MPRPLIVAYRGDNARYPENTHAAFASAIRQGADAIELDVHLTRDGELVVHHDYTLGRTVPGEGTIGDHTLADLEVRDAGSWFGPAFSGERMPTLGGCWNSGADGCGSSSSCEHLRSGSWNGCSLT